MNWHFTQIIHGNSLTNQLTPALIFIETRRIGFRHADMTGTYAEMTDTHAEMTDTHAEMIGTYAEMIGTYAEMIGTHAEMIGTHAEMIGTHAEMIGTHAEMTGTPNIPTVSKSTTDNDHYREETLISITKKEVVL